MIATTVLQTMRAMVRAGDIAGAEHQGVAFLEDSAVSVADRVAILIELSYVALRRPRGAGSAAAETWALEAVSLAENALAESDAAKIQADLVAAIVLHAARRDAEAWPLVRRAHAARTVLKSPSTSEITLYIEIALACGEGAMAVQDARLLVQREDAAGIPAIRVVAMLLYGKCLRASGTADAARAVFQTALQVATNCGFYEELLSEIRGEIARCY